MITNRPRRMMKGAVTLTLVATVSFFIVSLADAAKKARTKPASPPGVTTESGSSPSSASKGDGPSFDRLWQGKYIQDYGPYLLVYTADPILQASVNEIFEQHRPPFAAFVAMDPKTGKILALSEYSRENPSVPVWNRATYPAASVFKIITAASALEKGVLNHDSSVSFRGNQYRLGPAKIQKTSSRDQQTHFDEALGKSNNVVFGRVASKLVGAETLRRTCDAFGFNQPLPFDFPVESSTARIPEATYELARCGAGFSGVTLNPIHGAMIAACVANGGAMMRPYLVENVRSRDGEPLYEAKAQVLSRPISAKTAQDLNLMMRRTVEDGTAAKTFHRYGKDLVHRITVSGKTGSLSGNNPPGSYDWFVGFAPAEDPRIAFSAMVINHQPHKLRGVFVAQEALKTFFRDFPG
ncbi:MAG TPA: penicillin-binding transpeptidase domain-containing protein [Thermodesulfobacteriota bacterium]|nr:penicillin-binding transpeptidase domain-containing protein [Thermodesulfobacteriota bacterium]